MIIFCGFILNLKYKVYICGFNIKSIGSSVWVHRCTQTHNYTHKNGKNNSSQFNSNATISDPSSNWTNLDFMTRINPQSTIQGKRIDNFPLRLLVLFI